MDGSTATFEGLDEEAADQAARLLMAYAAQAETKAAEINAELGTCDWSGPDADLFRRDWGTTLSPGLQHVVSELRRHATALAEHAGRQRDVSR